MAWPSMERFWLEAHTSAILKRDINPGITPTNNKINQSIQLHSNQFRISLELKQVNLPTIPKKKKKKKISFFFFFFSFLN